MQLIAIDGPGGVGKSTVSRRLAEELGFYFLSSGLIYRAMAWFMLREGWNPSQTPESAALESFSLGVDGAGALWVQGAEVVEDLHAEEISQAASLLSAHGTVRDRSNAVQRETVARIEREASYPGVILEGRDIGTVVFPDATHKFFLTASEEVRAARRFKDMQAEDPGLTVEAVQEALGERDRRDETRELAPLKPAADAVIIDTSGLSLEGVVEAMLAAIRRGKAGKRE